MGGGWVVGGRVICFVEEEVGGLGHMLDFCLGLIVWMGMDGMVYVEYLGVGVGVGVWIWIPMMGTCTGGKTIRRGKGGRGLRALGSIEGFWEVMG